MKVRLCLIACLFILGGIISFYQPLTSNSDSSGAMTCIKDETTKFSQLSASQWHMDTNLGKVNASFIGEKTEDISGWALAGVGDVNNDGYDDIVIGATSNNEGGEDAGKTYLIFGRSTALWWMDVNLSEADVSFIGENSHDNLGWAVAGAGDVNNDGYDDIMIGASGNEEGGNDAGQTYLIFGRPTNQWQLDIDLAETNASFIGEEYDDSSGWSVAGVGDVNNDGYDDIVIGAIGNKEGGTGAGQTYLILGRPTNQWQMDIDLTESNASFIGESNYDAAGWAVAGVGDVNNDSFDDILIGAYNNEEGGSGAGQTYLILGRPTNQWQMDIDLAEANASFIGEDILDYSGWAVAGAGDVNNDSFDDILIGAYNDEEGGLGAGQTYLILGRPTNQWQMDIDLAEANASFIGEDTLHNSGNAVAGVGDTNRDGFDDIVIGARGSWEAGSGSGQAYLILGRPTNQWRPDMDLSESNASFIGEDNYDAAGWAVAGAGDVNNDGFADILISASGDEEGGEDAGQTYLILPYKPPKIDITSPINMTYRQKNVTLAYSVSRGSVTFFIDGVHTTSLPSGSILSNLSEGVHNVTLVVVAQGENVYINTIIFTLDNTPPIITINSPISGTYTTNIITINLLGEANRYWYYIEGVDTRNQTWIGIYDRMLPDGIYTLHAYGNDSVGNEGDTSVIFSIDSTPPNLKIDSPLLMIYTTSTIKINFSGNADHYWYYIEGVDTTNQSWNEVVNRTLSDGTYYLHVYGNDSIGNEGFSIVTFSIDTTVPILGIDSPLTMIYTTSTINFNFSGNADHFWYYIEGIDTTNQSWNEVVNRTLSDGTYILHIYGNNSIGNEGYKTVIFSIDTTPPNLQIDSPIAKIYTTSLIKINLSGNADHYWYYIEGVDTTNQSWNEVVNRTLSDGTYYLHVYGNDSVGNEAFIFMTFTINTNMTITSHTTTSTKNSKITTSRTRNNGGDETVLILSVSILGGLSFIGVLSLIIQREVLKKGEELPPDDLLSLDE